MDSCDARSGRRERHARCAAHRASRHSNCAGAAQEQQGRDRSVDTAETGTTARASVRGEERPTRCADRESTDDGLIAQPREIRPARLNTPPLVHAQQPRGEQWSGRGRDDERRVRDRGVGFLAPSVCVFAPLARDVAVAGLTRLGFAESGPESRIAVHSEAHLATPLPLPLCSHVLRFHSVWTRRARVGTPSVHSARSDSRHLGSARRSQRPLTSTTHHRRGCIAVPLCVFSGGRRSHVRRRNVRTGQKQATEAQRTEQTRTERRCL